MSEEPTASCGHVFDMWSGFGVCPHCDAEKDAKIAELEEELSACQHGNEDMHQTLHSQAQEIEVASMSGPTRIEWTDVSWNPVTGCSKVSRGCQFCYAERMAKRLAGRGGYPAENPFAVTLHPERLDEPLHWRKPRRVFVCSMGDLFHKDVPSGFITEVFAVMALCPQHTFQVLTKRPERMAEYLADEDLPDYIDTMACNYGACHANLDGRWPLPNVWLGTSVEDQATADERIPHLLRCPAAVRFVRTRAIEITGSRRQSKPSKPLVSCAGRVVRDE